MVKSLAITKVVGMTKNVSPIEQITISFWYTYRKYLRHIITTRFHAWVNQPTNQQTMLNSYSSIPSFYSLPLFLQSCTSPCLDHVVAVLAVVAVSSSSQPPSPPGVVCELAPAPEDKKVCNNKEKHQLPKLTKSAS